MASTAKGELQTVVTCCSFWPWATNCALRLVIMLKVEVASRVFWVLSTVPRYRA